MKHIRKLIIISALIISLTACKKDNDQPLDYRITHSNYQFYGSADIHAENSISYSDNHISNSMDEIISNSTIESKFINTYEYLGDSLINRLSIFQNDKWINFKRVYHNNNELITMINNYCYPDSTTLFSKKILKYENNKITEITDYDTFGVVKSYTKYQYNGENLSLASYSYRIYGNEDLDEYVRREFTYIENRLHEEIIYRDMNGYPIHLAYKKLYNYDNGLIVSVDNFKFEDDTFTLYQQEIYSYDEAGNNSSIIIKDPSGSLISESYLTYEPGTYKYQLIYDVVNGIDQPYPIN